jgi:hypothetical protein
LFGIFEPLEFEILKATFNIEETRRVVVGIQRGKWSGIAINGQSLVEINRELYTAHLASDDQRVHSKKQVDVQNNCWGWVSWTSC